ncbi:leucine-rich repeat domain-containing protein [Pseudobutyrivibrio sp. YE44]|uniref:leucine-rich repeat domain-containing protein n=1 Tax=Pseudobutyrivibrio sp. YE44 TaxID=1520802 RepID=UPI0015A16B4E|nr:leucine-rich repeat domain-containing protein [Pseudobutyrivibrio sp. YE44]
MNTHNKKVKSRYVIILLVIILVIVVARITLKGIWVKDYHYVYDFKDKQILAEAYRGNENIVELPSHLGPFDVALGSNIFSDTVITKIVIPNDFVKNYTFLHCDNLKEVEFENGTTCIDTWFKKCNGIEQVIIPETVSEIAGGTFEACEGLEKINIPESVKYIGVHAFLNTPFERSHNDDKYYVVGDGVLLFYNGSKDCVVVPKGIKQCNYFFTKSDEDRAVYYSETVENAYLMVPLHTTAYFGNEEIYFEESSEEDYQSRAGTLVAPAGSYVEKYCEEHKLNFRVMTEEEEAIWREKTEAAASEITYQDNN